MAGVLKRRLGGQVSYDGEPAARAWLGDGPPPDAGAAHWLDAAAVRQFEPSLSDEVVGGWWFPEDFQVDPRLLMASLRRACNFAGVSIVEGAAGTATQLIPDSTGRRIAEVRTESGMRFTDPEAVVVANGAWLRQLLPLPVTPHKGQMLALRPPPVATASSLGPTPQDSTPPSPLLTRTLFAESCYIIPKSDGRVVVGATVEPGRWDLRSTAAGVATLLGNAVDTCPELAEWEVVDTWAGLRPTTPDYLPILGRLDGYLENVYAVGGLGMGGRIDQRRTAITHASSATRRTAPSPPLDSVHTTPCSRHPRSLIPPPEGRGLLAQRHPARAACGPAHVRRDCRHAYIGRGETLTPLLVQPLHRSELPCANRWTRGGGVGGRQESVARREAEGEAEGARRKAIARREALGEQEVSARGGELVAGSGGARPPQLLLSRYASARAGTHIAHIAHSQTHAVRTPIHTLQAPVVVPFPMAPASPGRP